MIFLWFNYYSKFKKNVTSPAKFIEEKRGKNVNKTV
jgi:hypothetical protein